MNIAAILVQNVTLASAGKVTVPPAAGLDSPKIGLRLSMASEFGREAVVEADRQHSELRCLEILIHEVSRQKT